LEIAIDKRGDDKPATLSRGLKRDGKKPDRIEMKTRERSE
jgi:hypothetical protein